MSYGRFPITVTDKTGKKVANAAINASSKYLQTYAITARVPFRSYREGVLARTTLKLLTDESVRSPDVLGWTRQEASFGEILDVSFDPQDAHKSKGLLRHLLGTNPGTNPKVLPSPPAACERAPQEICCLAGLAS